MVPLNRRFSVAPMLDRTDRHLRYLLRLISKHVLLYTEMVTTGAIIHGDAARFLSYSHEEHPVALQLGGSQPDELAKCAKIAQHYGYDEVNLNVGCPSNRVQSGNFGACLMAEPELVADCIIAMKATVDLPITVKSRIGIDDMDDYNDLAHFVNVIYEQSQCDVFIVHARKAWLNGLSPKENRDIPPLCYPSVYRLKQDFPQLNIIINGGIKTIGECQQHLQKVDGVMLGREIYSNPFLLADVNRYLFQDDIAQSKFTVYYNYLDYIETQLSQGIYLSHLSRHLLSLFQGVPGAKAYRRHISENAHKAGADVQVLHDAIGFIKSNV